MRNIRKSLLLLLFGIMVVASATTNTNAEWYDDQNSSENIEGFNVSELVLAGHDFFGTATEGLGTAVETVFSALGRPDGYIIGEEASGAIIAGLTYGEGTITTKNLGEEKIYWQGPSIGIDYGGDGSRVMFLIYNMDNINDCLLYTSPSPRDRG